jgi:hypothetical protein
VKNIYLLGFDACVDAKKGKSHSTNDDIKEFKKFDIINDDKINSETHLIKVAGNFKEFVNTTSHFKGMIECFDEIKDNYVIEAFNLSNGAFLPGIKPLEVKKCFLNEVLNKELAKEEIHLTLLDISKNHLSELENKIINDDLSVLEKFEKLELSSIYNNFNSLKKNESSLLIQILNKYFKLVLPWYYYLKEFNENKANELFQNDFKNIINFIKVKK